jgi:hypothetical protein
MVNIFLKPLRRWPAVEALFMKVAGQFTTWPADDFDRFVRAPVGAAGVGMVTAQPPSHEPLRAPAPSGTAPATFEMRFMKMHSEGRLDEMWDLLAEDAQRAWGGRDAFVRGMPRLGDDVQLEDMRVLSTAVLPSWTDARHRRTYNNVAQLVMRYHVRQQWRDWSFDRQVHLIPAAGGWRTLCYPSGGRLSR